MMAECERAHIPVEPRDVARTTAYHSASRKLPLELPQSHIADTAYRLMVRFKHYHVR